MQLIKLLIKLVVVRILVPEDFGVMAVGLFIFAAAIHFSQLGLPVILIQSKQRENYYELLGKCLGLVLPWTLFLSLGLFLCAPFIQSWFDAPKLGSLIKIFSFGIFPTCLHSFLNGSLAFRQAYKKQARSELISAPIYGAVAALLFWFRPHIESLAISLVIYHYVLLLAVIKYTYLKKIKIMWQLKTLTGPLGHSKFVFLNGIISILVCFGDDALVAKVLGTESAGLYNLAFFLPNIVMNHFIFILCKMVYPSLCSCAPQLKKFWKLLYRYLLIAFIPTFIFSFIVFSFPDKIILFTYGKSYLDAAICMKIFSIFVMFRAINCILSYGLEALGLNFASLMAGAVQLIFLILLLPYLTYKYGINGAAVGTTAAMVLSTLTPIIILKIHKGKSASENIYSPLITT